MVPPISFTVAISCAAALICIAIWRSNVRKKTSSSFARYPGDQQMVKIDLTIPPYAEPVLVRTGESPLLSLSPPNRQKPPGTVHSSPRLSRSLPRISPLCTLCHPVQPHHSVYHPAFVPFFWCLFPSRMPLGSYPPRSRLSLAIRAFFGLLRPKIPTPAANPPRVVDSLPKRIYSCPHCPFRSEVGHG